MSSIFRVLAGITAVAGLLLGIYSGFLADGRHLGTALLTWISWEAGALLLLAVSVILDQLDEALEHLRLLTRDIRYRTVDPPPSNLGNSKANLEALKDFKMTVKDDI